VARLKERFPGVRWIRPPGNPIVPELRRAGIECARGEVVALLEDDCLAPVGWAAQVMQAHQSAYAAIGGAVEPGDYATASDWAVYFCEYGRFMGPAPERDVAALPGANVSYKRSVLDALATDGGATARGFYEVFVHATLRQHGHRLRSDPALAVRNVNSWTLFRAMRTRYHHGRGYSAMRVAGRRLMGRLPFIGLACVLPAVQLARVTRQVASRKRHAAQLAKAFPAVIALSVSWSAGELMGYLRGPGTSLRQWR
jgi:hypothetical protein